MILIDGLVILAIAAFLPLVIASIWEHEKPGIDRWIYIGTILLYALLIAIMGTVIKHANLVLSIGVG